MVIWVADINSWKPGCSVDNACFLLKKKWIYQYVETYITFWRSVCLERKYCLQSKKNYGFYFVRKRIISSHYIWNLFGLTNNKLWPWHFCNFIFKGLIIRPWIARLLLSAFLNNFFYIFFLIVHVFIILNSKGIKVVPQIQTNMYWINLYESIMIWRDNQS